MKEQNSPTVYRILEFLLPVNGCIVNYYLFLIKMVSLEKVFTDGLSSLTVFYCYRLSISFPQYFAKLSLGAIRVLGSVFCPYSYPMEERLFCNANPAADCRRQDMHLMGGVRAFCAAVLSGYPFVV